MGHRDRSVAAKDGACCERENMEMDAGAHGIGMWYVSFNNSPELLVRLI